MARIAVIGAGAMGSIYAALMADAGHEVWAVDTWQAHVDAIREHGLRVEGASGERTVTRIHATTDAADAGRCDLVVIATKAAGVASAAASIAPLIGPETTVMTIQNGLGAGERIREHLPGVPVLLGVAQGFGASMRGPGHAHHNGMSLIRIGEMEGGASTRAERVAAIWRESGFETRTYEDINQLIWEKFVCNVSYSAPCTAFARTIGEMLAQPDTRRICLACGAEAYAVGKARGIRFSFSDPQAYALAFGEGMPNARPSMYLDHLAGRRSEIDAINGMVPVLGAELGVPTPYNEVLSALVRAREARFAP